MTYTKRITMYGLPYVLACDGNCSKAWGIQARPHVSFNPSDPDDTALLADSELGDAPASSGNTEGGHDKPSRPDEMNKWCARQCERSVVTTEGAPFVLPDLSTRRLNKPWLHEPTR